MPNVVVALPNIGGALCSTPQSLADVFLDCRYMPCMYVCMYVSFGQGSSQLWTHTLRPFYSRPIALTQEWRSLVNDVCERVHD